MFHVSDGGFQFSFSFSKENYIPCYGYYVRVVVFISLEDLKLNGRHVLLHANTVTEEL